ncbi:MAG: hypothetical protein RR614_12205, partial [Eubacterium sp.]
GTYAFVTLIRKEHLISDETNQKASKTGRGTDKVTDTLADTVADMVTDNTSDTVADTLNKLTQLKPNQTKDAYGDFVTLTPDEYAKLTNQLEESGTHYYIERLNEYIGQIGEKVAAKRYKSHYHTILSFYRRDRERTSTPQSPTKNDYIKTKGESL